MRVYVSLVCFDPAYLRTQAAARMVSGCVSRFAMPSQPRWNGEGTPNQAGHGSTAARHPLEAAPPPPPDPLDTAPQPTSRVNIQASRTLSFSDRPLSCPTWFRAGCEGQGDGGKVASASLDLQSWPQTKEAKVPETDDQT